MIATVGPRPADGRPQPQSESIGSIPAGAPVRGGEPVTAVPPPIDLRPVDGLQQEARPVPRSLADHVAESLRPSLSNPALCSPAGIRRALDRFNGAVRRLCNDPAHEDPLLKTAHLVIEEERLRVEILRQRLQMVLKG